jgi:myb proto-oncogene protein
MAWYFDPSINRKDVRTGKWRADEDSKLEAAVETHGGKDWAAVALLVPGRTQKQCNKRWCEVLDPSIDKTNGRTGKWRADEDSKLKAAVETHGGKDWAAVVLLVPGRTQKQWDNRWRDTFDPSIDQMKMRTGQWTALEDSELKAAVETHGGKDWATVVLLVPGRTRKQCNQRWCEVLDPSINQTMKTASWRLQ